MAHNVLFDVQCSACGQVLHRTVTEDGVVHSHENAADCDEPNVTLPLVSVEQVEALFKPEKKHAAHAPAKAVSKGKGK